MWRAGNAFTAVATGNRAQGFINSTMAAAEAQGTAFEDVGIRGNIVFQMIRIVADFDTNCDSQFRGKGVGCYQWVLNATSGTTCMSSPYCQQKDGCTHTCAFVSCSHARVCRDADVNATEPSPPSGAWSLIPKTNVPLSVFYGYTSNQPRLYRINFVLGNATGSYNDVYALLAALSSDMSYVAKYANLVNLEVRKTVWCGGGVSQRKVPPPPAIQHAVARVRISPKPWAKG